MAVCLLSACGDDTSSEQSSLSVNESSLEFPQEGGSLKLTIVSNSNWSISNLPYWISSSTVSGIGNSTVTLKAEANENIDDRSGSITVFTNDGNNKKIVTVSQSGTHVSPLQVDNIAEKVFSGKQMPFYEDSIVITSNTRWIIEGPSWLSATFKNKNLELDGNTTREGAGVIYLVASETYTGQKARQGNITIKTIMGEKGVEIPVTQLGKDDIFQENKIVLTDCIVPELKFGAEVTAFRWAATMYALAPSDLTYDNIQNQWIYSPAPVDDHGVMWINADYPNTDYTFYYIGIDDNNYFAPLDYISKHVAHTASDVNQPKATISNVYYQDGTWHWDVKMDAQAVGYFAASFYKSELDEIGLIADFSKPYCAWAMAFFPICAFVKESTYFWLKTTDDIVICAWAVDKDYKLSNVMDFYVTSSTKTSTRTASEQGVKSIMNNGMQVLKNLRQVPVCKDVKHRGSAIGQKLERAKK